MTTSGEPRVPPSAGVAVPTDRRYRRPDHRLERRRTGRRVGRVTVWVALGLMLAAGASRAFDWLYRADALRVKRVEVRGNTRLSAGDVDVLIDGMRGENILQVDFDEYRRRLLDSPWIAGATFRRALPSTIDIQVIERTPLAIARLGAQLYLVDDTGVIIDEYGAAYQDLDLPIVDGLFTAPSADGPLMDVDRLQLVRALLTSLASRPQWSQRMSQVRVPNAHDVVVMFDVAPVWLHLGNTRFAERLQRYFEIAPTLQERLGGVESVDLRFDDRVFVLPRTRGGRSAPPATPAGDSTVERPSAGRAREDAHGA